MSPTVSLQLFGGCVLRFDGALVTGPVAQRRRLALLAVVAFSRSAGISRDKLTGYFWPEEDRERARHFLADSLFTIRKALGKDAILATADDVRLNPERFSVDVWRFDDLHGGGDHSSAVSLYRGPFLDGFFVSEAPDFERWADSERERLASIYAESLERLAEEQERVGNPVAASEWWKRLSSHDPYSARIALRAMESLENAGDPAAAIQHAAKYERIVRDDLELPPAPAVLSFASRLRSAPSEQGILKPIATIEVRPLSPPVTIQDRDSAAAEPAPPANPRPGPRYAVIGGTLAIVFIAGVFYLIRNGGVSGAPSPASAMLPDISPARTAGSGVEVRSARAEAEDLYHQGRLLTENAVNPGDFRQAIMFHERAIIRDPAFAKPYAGKAEAYVYGNDPARAKGAVEKALALDGTMAEAHAARAYILAYYEHRWLDAIAALERVVGLEPDFTLAQLRLATIYAIVGRGEDAMSSIEKARQLEPQSWVLLYNRGLIASILGRPKDAITHLQATVALKPDRRDIKVALADELWRDGRIAEAAATYRGIGFLNSALIKEGDTTEMRRLVRRHETDSITMRPATLARLYAQLGERDAAFRALRRAVVEDRYLPADIRNPPLSWLKTDRRYARVMAELGLGEPTTARRVVEPRPLD